MLDLIFCGPMRCGKQRCKSRHRKADLYKSIFGEYTFIRVRLGIYICDRPCRPAKAVFRKLQTRFAGRRDAGSTRVALRKPCPHILRRYLMAGSSAIVAVPQHAASRPPDGGRFGLMLSTWFLLWEGLTSQNAHSRAQTSRSHTSTSQTSMSLTSPSMTLANQLHLVGSATASGGVCAEPSRLVKWTTSPCLVDSRCSRRRLIYTDMFLFVPSPFFLLAGLLHLVCSLLVRLPDPSLWDVMG